MNARHPFALAVLSFALAAMPPLLGGCNSGNAAAENDGNEQGHSHADGHDHSHDHDHFHEHDHVTAEHRPKDYAEAVARIRELHGEIGGEFAEGHADHADEAVHVMLDIARWLPEIAADSDMQEEDWSAVKADAESLGSIFDDIHHAIHDGQEINYEDATADMSQLIRRLEAIADAGDWNLGAGPRLQHDDSDVAGGEASNAETDASTN